MIWDGMIERSAAGFGTYNTYNCTYIATFFHASSSVSGPDWHGVIVGFIISIDNFLLNLHILWCNCM